MSKLTTVISLAIVSFLTFTGCAKDPEGTGNTDTDDTSMEDSTTQEDTQQDTQTDTGTDNEQKINLPREKAAWTIMMYEDADNNLEAELLDDINEAEAADLPDDVNFIVLVDRTPGYDNTDGNWKGAKLFWLAHDEEAKKINSPRLADPDFLKLTDTSEDGEELDMGSPDTLENFIKFCQKNFPADHYILHFSDHGDGWKKLQSNNVETAAPILKGTCTDESSGNTLSISEDIPKAIKDKGLEAISYDACIMGNVEVAWAMAPHVDYLSASAMSIPGAGWDYTTTLNTWFKDKTAENWVVAAADDFMVQYANQPNVGLTALDLRDNMSAFAEKLDAFIDEAMEIPFEDFREIRNGSYRPDMLSQSAMRDFNDMVERCEGFVSPEKITELTSAMDDLHISHQYSDNMSQLKSILVFAPGPHWSQGIGGYDVAYDDTPFALATRWDELILAKYKIEE